MREILFRGKRKYNGEWVYGNLIFTSDGSPHIFTVKESEEDGHHVRFDTDLPSWVYPETVGQYTGLTDKNGVKIFEGDIMVLYAGLIRPKIIVIAWSDYCCGWCAKYKDDEYEIPTKNEILGRMEIIGNIHDTPELLGRG
jgi:uncharacterized phage protein (TIGR01671 family)